MTVDHPATRPSRPADRPGGLLTSVVGSHAHPSWLVSGLAAAERGEFGPVDLAEMLDDAVAIAVDDQVRAGIDVITDGEMRRAGFFTAEFYHHLTGLRPLPPARRLGAGAHDQQHRLEVLAPISAPDGLGVVAEYRAAVGLSDPRGGGRGLRAPAARRGRRPGRRRSASHPGGRAVAGHPSRRRRRLRGPVQRGHRAGGRTRSTRRPLVLRELPRAAAGQADLPAHRRGHARLLGRGAGARVRQPRAGGDRAGRRVDAGRPRRGGGRHRRQEFVPGNGRRRRRADRPGAGHRGACGATGAGPRLRLQPDGPLDGGGQTAGAGRRARPGQRQGLKEERMDGHRITMLGTGLIGDFYTNILHGQRGRDRVRVVYSRSEARGTAFRERWGIPESATDLAGAVDHPETDVVVVGLPNHLHEEAVGLAAAAGKAVLCTKPLGRTADEARRMLEAVERAGGFGGYLEDLCYTPKTLKAIASAQAGAIGDVTWVRSRETHPGPHSAWFWDGRLTGGGAIIDLGCHCIEIIRNFVGKGNRPVEVLCHTDTLVHPIADEDNAIALILFESGAIGQFEVSWTFRGGMDLRDEVAGTHGTIWMDHFLRTGFEMFTAGGGGGYVAEKAETAAGWLFPVGDEVSELGYVDMFSDMFDAI